MIDRFIVGKYYKWIGPPVKPSGWNRNGCMDAMLDGKPHLCISTDVYSP